MQTSEATDRWAKPRVWLALAGLAATSAVAACGQDEPARTAPRVAPGDDREIRTVVGAYFAAVEEGDGARMCAALTTDLRRYVAELQQTSCARTLASEARALPESLGGYRIRSIAVDGARAKVVLASGSAGGDEMRLRRVGRTWRISSAPGLGA